MNKQHVRKAGRLFGAAGMIMLGSAVDAWAQNLLVNPGFESPQSPAQVDTEASGWTFVGDAARANFFNHTPGGSKSIWHKTFNPVGGGVTQNVGITAGATYNLSAFHLFEAAYPTTEAVVQMGMTWRNAQGGSVGTPNFLNIQPSSVTQTGVWLPFSIMGVAPAGATQVEVFLGWMGGGTVKGAQSAFVDDAFLEGPGQPPTDSVWIINGSGDWNQSGNWANGVVPNGPGTHAIFGPAITSAQTVFTNTATTVGSLTFNNPNTYVIAGAGSLTLQVTSGTAAINVQQGAQKINLPVRFASNTNVTVSPGAALNFADPVTVGAGRTVNTTGSVSINAPLTIESGGTLGIGSSARLFGAPSIGSGARLDVKNNSVAVDYNPGNSPLTTIRSQLASGYAGGAWNGSGIISSNANSTTHGVGYGEATAVFTSFPATFAGGQVDDTTVLMRYTRYGDANLDGQVNLADFNRLASNFGSTNAVWTQGDFNYDSNVNLADFNRLASNFGMSAAGPEVTPEDWAALAAAVPEPVGGATLALAGLVAAGTRRRRAS